MTKTVTFCESCHLKKHTESCKAYHCGGGVIDLYSIYEGYPVTTEDNTSCGNKTVVNETVSIDDFYKGKYEMCDFIVTVPTDIFHHINDAHHKGAIVRLLDMSFEEYAGALICYGIQALQLMQTSRESTIINSNSWNCQPKHDDEFIRWLNFQIQHNQDCMLSSISYGSPSLVETYSKIREYEMSIHAYKNSLYKYLETGSL